MCHALGAGAFANIAGFHGRDADFCLGAESGLFQRDFEVVTQVGAPVDVGTSAATPGRAENLVENPTKSVGKASRTAAKTAHSRLRVNAGMTELVVGRALLRVGENLVGLFRFFEMFFRFGIVRIAIRVVFHGQFAVGLLNFFVGGVSVDAENVVKIAFSHGILFGMRDEARRDYTPLARDD